MSWSQAESLSLPKWEPLQQLQWGSGWRSVLTEVPVRNPLGFLLSSLVLNEVWEK